MITKELFCEIIANIKKQSEIDHKFGEALETVCDGYIVYGTENLYLHSLLELLKNVMHDDNDYIEWWLYEAVEKIIWSSVNDKKWLLDTPEKLYDFLVERKEADD